MSPVFTIAVDGRPYSDAMTETAWKAKVRNLKRRRPAPDRIVVRERGDEIYNWPPLDMKDA